MPNITVTMGEDTWVAAKNPGAGTLPGYEAYATGNNNPQDAAGKKPGTSAFNAITAKGSVVHFKPIIDGHLKIAVKQNKGADKTLYLFAGTQTVVAENAGEAESQFLIVEADVKANVNYCLYQLATKVGFFGFEFTEDQTGGSTVNYNLNSIADNYVLGGNCVASTYSEKFSVDYTGTPEKMQVMLSANNDIFFEYANSQENKGNIIKTADKYVTFDGANFVINTLVKKGDVIKVKYSAKGANAAKLEIYGSASEVIEENQGSVSECSGTTEADAVEFSATAIKGGTAKIKETSGGMKLYSITITSASPTAVAGVAESKAEAKAAPVKVITANGIQIGNYNIAGQQVK